MRGQEAFLLFSWSWFGVSDLSSLPPLGSATHFPLSRSALRSPGSGPPSQRSRGLLSFPWVGWEPRSRRPFPVQTHVYPATGLD